MASSDEVMDDKGEELAQGEEILAEEVEDEGEDPDFDLFLRDILTDYLADSDDFEEDEIIATVPVDLLHPFGNLNESDDCEICLSKESKVRNRLCCQIPVCDDCMEKYFVTQIESGFRRMQCISSGCSEYAHVDEIMCRLPVELKDKFYKYLVDTNNDPYVKTCPNCSYVQRVTKEELDVPKKKRKYGCHIVCKDCHLEWCFICHAPWHREGITCKDYQKGDKLVKNWAKEFHYGNKNAERCPKCKIFIERTSGCDHMTCKNCHTVFCYKCGEKYIKIKFIGDHYGRFSPLGCKHKLLPNKPVLRKVIRGSALGAKLFGGILLGGLAIGGAAIFVAVSPIVVPAYFGHKYRMRRRYRRTRRKLRKQDLYMMQHDAQFLEAMQISLEEALQAQIHDIVIHGDQSTQTTLPGGEDDGSSLSSKEDEEEAKEGRENEEAGKNENVKVIIHNQDDGVKKPSTIIEVEEENQVHVTGGRDSHMTTADLETQSDGQVVLHVKTTSKSSEEEKKLNQSEEGDFTFTENEDSISNGGCLIKILKKLPSVWEKEKDGEKIQKWESTDDSKSIKDFCAPSDQIEGDVSPGSLKFSDTLECLKQLQVESELKDSYYGLVSTTDEITYL
ncbi:uncharacterized protein LOC133186080 [Saccostrea echinata]|uniref:uncharacterized protein LOC133186080 n=1 Tax=Saccostrea echinata TaxID=191078 RepID=UPI002A7FF5EF|nr:uncharacterized protein LOC133186080 [Saccostrea echinata]